MSPTEVRIGTPGELACAVAFSTPARQFAGYTSGGAASMTPKRRRAAGLTLVELIIAVAVMSVALLALVTVILVSTQLQRVTREKTLAYNAARGKIEEMRNTTTFAEIFVRYNSSTADNPGAGSSPGNTFDVTGLLRVQTATPVGRIDFPESGGALREDIHSIDSALATGLGMPSGKDLNRDGAIDSSSHNADFKILPIRIVIRWLSGPTPVQIEVKSFIGEK